MEDQSKFQEMLKDVLEVARVQGDELGMNEIKDLFGGIGLQESQYEHIFAYLAANHIKVKGYVNTKVLDEYKDAVKEEENKETKQDEENEQKEFSEEDGEDHQEGKVKGTVTGNEKEGKTLAKEEDSQYLKMYLADLSAIKEPDEIELKDLIQTVREKRIECKERFIEIHLHKVVELAKLYRNRGVTLEDLIQEGNIGLLCGVESLYADTVTEDEERYLEGYIKNALEDIIYESSQGSTFEENIIGRISYVRNASKDLEEELGREGTIHELARYVKMSEEELIDIINISAEGVKLSKEHKDSEAE